MNKLQLQYKSALANLSIENLNSMQLDAIQGILNNKQLILLSPTGTGKTLAFLLPLLNIMKEHETGVQVMLLAPSRELCLQIEQVFKQLKTGFRVLCCYGGHPISTEKSNLKTPPALLIGTPGRIADHLRHERIETRSIKTIIVDEFDKSLEFGFEGEMVYIMRQLLHIEKKVLTSATSGLALPAFFNMDDAISLNYLTDELVDGLELKAVYTERNEKPFTLLSLLCQLSSQSSLVFCNHREAVERLSEYLTEHELPNDIYHGGMDQDKRELALIKFRNGSNNLLITTDLASRGLDIPNIETIVHYQLPVNESAYIHRNGRTSRMHAKGTSFLVLCHDDTLPPWISQIPMPIVLNKISNLPAPPLYECLYIGAGKKERINKVDIVGFLIQKGKLAKEDIGLIDVLDHASYVAIKSKKLSGLLRLIRNESIKKKKVKIEKAH